MQAPSAEEVAGRIENTLQRFPWLVCADGDDVLGYAYAGPHRQRAAFQLSVEVSVYVEDGSQRRGVGRACTLALRLPASARLLQGLRRHRAAQRRQRRPARGRRFRHVGTFDDVGYKLGRWHPVGYWELTLQPPSTPREPTPLQEAAGTEAWREALTAGEALLRKG